MNNKYKVVGNLMNDEEYHYFEIGSEVEQVGPFTEAQSGELVAPFLGVDKEDGQIITQYVSKEDVENV